MYYWVDGFKNVIKQNKYTLKVLGLILAGSALFCLGNKMYYRYFFKNIVSPLEYKLYLLNKKINCCYKTANKSLVKLEIDKQEIVYD